ncbi:MAG: hypothetical protein NTZ93_00255 [Candidatus Beckwithbacteria bacterium]|nr:hypothetical protein [Candidatus Beckwithbacteria bacterium]
MIAFIQALGLIGYCSLIAFFVTHAQDWFGRMPNFFGPFLMLTLLSTSALICGLIVFTYPVKLYLKTKKYNQPIKVVLLTAAWLAVFSLLIMLGIGLNANL